MELIMFLSLLIMFLISVGIWILVGVLWNNFRDFFHNNYSFFDVSFIGAYFIEQIALTLLIRYYPNEIILWSGLMSIVVVTTASLQKVTSESRIRDISNITTKQHIVLHNMKKANEKILKDNMSLKESSGKMKEFAEKLLYELKILDKKLKKKR